MRHDYAAIAASTIAAVLLAVNPAAAGDPGKKASGSVSTGTSSSVTTDTKTDGSVSGGVSTDGSVSGTTSGTLSTDSPSASPKMEDSKDTLDAEKKTGLDRADEAAGPHGQHGRDNAREHQEQKESPSASPRMDDQNKDQSSTTTEDKK
jgi:hypothetical protein